MRAELQQRIAPPSPPNSRRLIEKETPSSDGAEANPVDFKALLQSSNEAVRAKRERRKSGDLASADSYQDFLQQLNRETEEASRPKNELGKDDFLTLFVTQLKNQDPLNPQDSAQMASQLAQFNSVEQMMNINTSLGELEQTSKDTQEVQLVNYLGKDVSLEGGRVHLREGALNAAFVTVDEPLSNAKLSVSDANGKVVWSDDLGELKSGEHPLKWDGVAGNGEKQREGFYTLAVTSRNPDGNDIDLPLRTETRIDGLSFNEGNVIFATALGDLRMNDIAKVMNPPLAALKPEVEMPPAPATPALEAPTAGPPPLPK